MNLYEFVGNDGISQLDFIGLALLLNIQRGYDPQGIFAAYHATNPTTVEEFRLRVFVGENQPFDWNGGTNNPFRDNDDSSPTDGYAGEKFDPVNEPKTTAGSLSARPNDASILDKSFLIVRGTEDGCKYTAAFLIFYDGATLIAEFLPRRSSAERDFPETLIDTKVHVLPEREVDSAQVDHAEPRNFPTR